MGKPFKINRWLVPLGWLFGNVARLRRWLYARGMIKSHRPEIPVICVGNIAIGGTGKTPHTSYIVDMLSQNYHVALLSRGYGRKTKGFVLANTTPPEQLSANLIGDEPLLLHYRFPQLPLAVDGNRKEGVRKLQQYDPQVNVVVMDDAYQHLNFSPTVRLVLTEYHRPYFKDYPLPAGRLREFPDAARAADAVIVTKVDVCENEVDRDQWRENLALKKTQPLFFTKYEYGRPEPVTEMAPLIIPTAVEVVLLTGIAQPQPLLEHLQHRYMVCKHFRFPDHHPYSSSDMDKIRRFMDKETRVRKVVFTTEKDWMRLLSVKLQKELSLLPVYIVPIQVVFLTECEKVSFNNIIENYVRRTKD